MILFKGTKKSFLNWKKGWNKPKKIKIKDMLSLMEAFKRMEVKNGESR